MLLIKQVRKNSLERDALTKQSIKLQKIYEWIQNSIKRQQKTKKRVQNATIDTSSLKWRRQHDKKSGL